MFNIFSNSEQISDSNESIRRTSDLAHQAGHQRRTKELLSWARRRRHLIRREELIAYLAGRNLPARPHRASPRPKMLHEGQPVANPLEDNLNTFREALALSGMFKVFHYFSSSFCVWVICTRT